MALQMQHSQRDKPCVIELNDSRLQPWRGFFSAHHAPPPKAPSEDIELHRPSSKPAPVTGPALCAYDTYVQVSGERSSAVASSPLQRFWKRHKPPILVALSQLFAAWMNLNARLLEVEGEAMHPAEILLLRQGPTAVACCVYGWWTGVADFPLGSRQIRRLLCVRSLAGFSSIYAVWCSMMYLPLSDVTVITFLAPGMAGVLCYFVLGEPWPRAERIATIVALVGVVLIARPVSLFSDAESPHPPSVAAGGEGEGASASSGIARRAAAGGRVWGVALALIGAVGAAGAFVSLRIIGKRAHPLISVNYFAVACTAICALALALAPSLDIGQPRLRWIMPSSLQQWGLLCSLIPLGFLTQYLITAGLGADKSNRANYMIYTHMLFAAIFDRWVFGHIMDVMSFLGCALILGSAVTVILIKKKPVSNPNDEEGDEDGIDDDIERR